MTSNYSYIYDKNFMKKNEPHEEVERTPVSINRVRHAYYLSLTTFFLTWGVGYRLMRTSTNPYILRLVQNSPAFHYFIPFMAAAALQMTVFEELNAKSHYFELNNN